MANNSGNVNIDDKRKALDAAIAMRMCPQLLQIGKAKSTGIRLPGAKRMPMIATNDEGIINITYI